MKDKLKSNKLLSSIITMFFIIISVSILSLIFSKSLINNKSLIPGIILHSYWDLLMFMFY